MRTLITIIAEILNSVENIPDLPPDKLIALQNHGKPIPGNVNNVTLLKIARLQTLIVKEQKKSGMPEIDTLKQTATETGGDLLSTLATSMDVREDTVLNIVMLERLIVEIVRNACPEECERFGVIYSANISMRVSYHEEPQRRFLD